MNKNTLNKGSDQEIIQALLKQRATERAQTKRWNIYSLLLIWLVLALIIILNIFDANLYLTGGIAMLGLIGLWLITYRRGKKLEKVFFHEETENLKNRFPSQLEPNTFAAPAAEPSPLSPREMEVLTLIVRGNSNKEIAKLMCITPQTTKNHITHILKKLDVADRTAAAVMALSLGWVKSGTHPPSITNNNNESSE